MHPDRRRSRYPANCFQVVPENRCGLVQLAFAALLSPIAINNTIQWGVSTEPFDEGDTFIWVDVDLVAKATTKRPDDEVNATGVLKCVRLQDRREGSRLRRQGGRELARRRGAEYRFPK